MNDETQSYPNLRREFVRAWTSFSRMKNATTAAQALALGLNVTSHDEASDRDDDEMRALTREVAEWLERKGQERDVEI